MITNFKQYAAAMDFELDPHMSFEEVVQVVDRMHEVYYDVMMNVLNLEERTRVFNSMCSLLLHLAYIELAMAASPNESTGGETGYECYAPFEMDERTKEDYN